MTWRTGPEVFPVLLSRRVGLNYGARGGLVFSGNTVVLCISKGGFNHHLYTS